MSSFALLSEESKIQKRLENSEIRKAAIEEHIAKQREKMKIEFKGKWGDIEDDSDFDQAPEVPELVESDSDSESDNEEVAAKVEEPIASPKIEETKNVSSPTEPKTTSAKKKKNNKKKKVDEDEDLDALFDEFGIDTPANKNEEAGNNNGELSKAAKKRQKKKAAAAAAAEEGSKEEEKTDVGEKAEGASATTIDTETALKELKAKRAAAAKKKGNTKSASEVAREEALKRKKEAEAGLSNSKKKKDKQATYGL